MEPTDPKQNPKKKLTSQENMETTNMRNRKGE